MIQKTEFNLSTKPHWHFRLNPLSIGFALTCLMSFLVSTQAAESRNLYVSRNGNNADGLTWQTAWSELSNINWNTVQSSDVIYLDGGNGSMTYNTGLFVPAMGGGASLPLKIRRAETAGRNGKVIIDRMNQAGSYGIRFSRYFVDVDGRKWDGIEIRNCTTGVDLPLGTSTNHVYGCDIHHNQTGVKIGGNSNGVGHSRIHDNSVVNVRFADTEVVVYPGAGATNCWIYNTEGQPITDGVVQKREYSWMVSGGTLNDCVIGPNLRNGVSGSNTLNGCLLLNAQEKSINLVDYNDWFQMNYCTTYMTPLNRSGLSHDTLAWNWSSKNIVKYSIFYGGNIRSGYAAQRIGNTQFRTTGYTSYVSSSMVDPMFQSDVSNFPNNVSGTTLSWTNFALKVGSPATGTGARVTSAYSLMTTKRPDWGLY